MKTKPTILRTKKSNVQSQQEFRAKNPDKNRDYMRKYMAQRRNKK